MKPQSLIYWMANIEIYLTFLLIFYFLNPSLPPAITSFLNPMTYGFVSILIICRWKRFLYVITRDVPLLLLFAMVVMSGFWSDMPDATSFTSKAVIRAMLFAIYLAARYSIKEQMFLLSWALGTATLISFAVGIAIPSYGRLVGTNSWVGLFAYKNSLAIYMVLAAMLFLLTAIGNEKKSYIALIGTVLATALLFLSQGKGGYSIFTVALCLFPLRQFVKQQYKLRVIFFLSAFIIGGTAITFISNNLELIVVDFLGKNLEFNGRTPIWVLCIEQALKRPWLGYGVAGFWGSQDSIIILNATWAANHFSLNDFEGFNSHNSYLELILQLGFLGFSLYLWSFFTTLIRTVSIWITTSSEESFWMFQTLIILFLFNFTDNGGILSRGMLWIIYISISLSSIVWHDNIYKYIRFQKTTSKS